MMYSSQEKKGNKSGRNPKSDKDTAVPQDKERVYGVDHLNVGDPAVKSEGDSKWLLVHRREGQMANKEYRNNIIKRECNVISNLKP